MKDSRYTFSLFPPPGKDQSHQEYPVQLVEIFEVLTKVDGDEDDMMR